MKCRLFTLGTLALFGHRLHGPFSPGLAGSLVRSPFSSWWIGSSHGAPLWFAEKGTRLPKCGLKSGQAILPVTGSNRIGGLVLSSHFAAAGYFGFLAVLSRSPLATSPSHFQSQTVAS